MLSLQAGISGAAVGSIEMGADADQPVWLCLLGYFRLLRINEGQVDQKGGAANGRLEPESAG